MISSSFLHFLAALICFVFLGLPTLAIFFWYLLGWIARYFIGIYLSRKHGHSIEFLEPLTVYHSLNHGKLGPWVQLYYIFKGTTDFQQVKKKIQNNFVFVKNSDGTLRNSRLHQRVAKSFSYFYWLPIKNLNIDDHVQFYRGSKPKTYDELFAVFKTTRATRTMEPPHFWYFTYVTLDDEFEGLDGGPHFALLSDFDHALADGLSWTTNIRDALLTDVLETKSNQRKITNNSPPKAYEMWKTLRNVFYAPISLVTFVWKARDSHLLTSTPNGKLLVKTCSSPLCVDRLRKIRDAAKLQVTVNDLLVSCAAISLRRYFSKHGDGQIPKYLTVAIAKAFYDLSSSDIELTNNTGVIFAYIPLTEETALGCLKSTGKSISEAKNSTEIWIATATCAYNYLPTIFEKSYSLSCRPTFLLSNVPTCSSKYLLGESQLVCYGFIPHCRGYITVAIALAQNAGYLNLNIGIDSSVASEKDVEDILIGFVEAINELETASGLKKND